MSLYQIKKRAYDRMENLTLCEKNCEYLLSVSKEKDVKNICASLDTSPNLVCIEMLFPKIEGNGGARGASHIVILFNPLRPKSNLNEIYHLSVREIMTIENIISQVKFC